jgi:hypothetical protein
MNESSAHRSFRHPRTRRTRNVALLLVALSGLTAFVRAAPPDVTNRSGRRT